MQRCQNITGSSTFAGIILEEGDLPIINAVNLGDSGYLIIREKDEKNLEVIFHSPSQQYKFNHPYQCGSNHKLPYHADEFKHKVEDKDIIILASDGLWDNMTD